MREKSIWGQAKCALHSLHLTDKFLLIFMVILMLQSAYNLFFGSGPAFGSGTLDIIVRTTAAAIFGYFISANFNNGDKNLQKKEEPLNLEEGSRCSLKGGCRNNLQICVVSSLGLFALIILIISRNYGETTAASVATMSQLRDFVSGSVGFLIGHPTQNRA